MTEPIAQSGQKMGGATLPETESDSDVRLLPEDNQ